MIHQVAPDHSASIGYALVRLALVFRHQQQPRCLDRVGGNDIYPGPDASPLSGLRSGLVLVPDIVDLTDGADGAFLDNDLAEGRFEAGDKPVALTDIRVPIFAVGTERDHVAPWRSTYKIHLLTDTDVTYLLTTGGHNVGIVSEPDGRARSFRVMTKNADHYVDPATWLVQASQKQGSWWPQWVAWLSARSGEATAPPSIGAVAAGLAPLGDAPGTYVLQE